MTVYMLKLQIKLLDQYHSYVLEVFTRLKKLLNTEDQYINYSSEFYFPNV